MAINISDVKLHLTQAQFIVLMGLSRSIPRVLEGAPQGVAQAESVTSSKLTETRVTEQPSSTDLQPELRGSSSTQGFRSWTTLDLG